MEMCWILQIVEILSMNETPEGFEPVERFKFDKALRLKN